MANEAYSGVAGATAIRPSQATIDDLVFTNPDPSCSSSCTASGDFFDFFEYIQGTGFEPDLIKMTPQYEYSAG